MILIFELREHGGRWVVRLCNKPYGEYLSGDEARIDAIEAATEAHECGNEAEVWDRSTETRVF